MATPLTTRPDSAPETPALRDGDRLTRAEFERRYEAMPGLKMAELIYGVVHMPSPVRWDHHASPDVNLTVWLGTYRAYTPGLQAGHNASVRLEPESMPQPELLMFLPGGKARISADDYVEGAPDFLAEVSASTKSIDLGEKFRLYRENQVQEYLVWRVEDRAVDWFVLRDGEFVRLAPGADSVYRSEVFPGVWLDAAALIQGDLFKVLQVLQQGIATPEHAAFVTRLQQLRTP